MLGLLYLPIQHGYLLPFLFKLLEAAGDLALHLVQSVLERAHFMQSRIVVHAAQHGVGEAHELGPAGLAAQLAVGLELLHLEALLEQVDGAFGAVNDFCLLAHLLVCDQSVLGLNKGRVTFLLWWLRHLGMSPKPEAE